ncbi:major facilitator superfamily protein [Rhodococcus ruber BKS 20-38]|uniref:Putative proline/betaine transporter n=1 Tax=Rhodococcus ruber BKS 20-38 TaxID=1278076 RepID=M2ZXW9_9NOCA|nr:major facilitator superfamily protein [Rhodococcus ruber BKS 20-38]
MAAATVGNLVEWFDWYVYAMLALFFAEAFFPKNSGNPLVPLMGSLAIFAVGFFMRPLGGLLLGVFADRHGRKRALTLSIVLMGGGSLLIAVSPTYEQVGVLAPMVLVIARLAQGLSAGGEFAAASTFLVESAPTGRRGLFSSFLYVSATLGNILAMASVTVLVNVLSSDAMHSWGWRIPFLIGATGALVGMWVRRHAHETHETDGAANDRTGTARPRMFDFVRSHPRQCLQVVTVNAAALLVFYVFASYLPTYAKLTVGFDTGQAYVVSLISLTYFMLLQPVMGAMSDRFGRKPLLLFFAGGIAIATVPLLSALDTSVTRLLLVQLIALTFLAGYTSVAPAVMVELFPARIRAAGIGFPYAVTVALFGGTGPYVATWLIGSGWASLFGYYIAGLAAVSFVTFVFMKETHQKTLS